MVHKFAILLLFLFIVSSCSNRNSEENKEVKSSPNTVIFSDEQLEITGIKWNKLQKHNIADVIECNGTIEVPPQNKITVSPSMGGRVKEIRILPESYVKKNEVLAVLEHQDYLKIQQEYIEAVSRYTYQKEDYKRQGELTLEQATSLKKMQLSESEFRSLEAKVFSLKKQLEMLGINAEDLKPENISSEIKLLSPIDGYITCVFINRGKYIGIEENLCEIIDKSHLYVSLNVFEKDLLLLKQGQKITFYPAASPNKTYSAVVELIGQSINEEDHSVTAHAHITSSTNNLKPGMFVTAKIISNTRFVFTLPITSLVKKDSNFFVYIYNNKKFERTSVTIGKEVDKNVEIILPDSGFIKTNFVINGACYLESEWEKDNK